MPTPSDPLPTPEDTPELRKARGAFFTPPEVARYLCEWAIRSADDRVYEPSCGEADFLLAAGARLRTLGASTIDGNLLEGAELHAASAAGALADPATAVSLSNAFDGLVSLIATRNPDFYEVGSSGSLIRVRS